MKKLILVLLAIIILFACEQKSKIEIVADLDMQYLPNTMVDTMSKFVVGTKIEPLPFSDVIKEIHETENPNEEVIYPVYLRWYVNEFGKIDKIKILPNNLDRVTRNNPEPKYKELIYSKTETIVRNALSKIEKYKFTPAKLNGKNVKSRADIKIIYMANKNGDVGPDEEKMKIEHVGSDFDNPISGIYFVAVEQMPAPIGGIEALQENIQYPEIAKRAGIEGRVFVKAYIDSTGTVTKSELIRGIGAGCDEAAMEAVKKLKFTPGLQRGKRVNVQVTVPILFKLDETPEKEKGSKSQNEILSKGYNDFENGGKGKVEGKIVSSEDGSPIVAANLFLEGTKLGCSTHHLGEFFVTNIPPGEYYLQFSHPDYGQQKFGKIKVLANKSLIVEIKVKTK